MSTAQHDISDITVAMPNAEHQAVTNDFLLEEGGWCEQNKLSILRSRSRQQTCNNCDAQM